MTIYLQIKQKIIYKPEDVRGIIEYLRLSGMEDKEIKDFLYSCELKFSVSPDIFDSVIGLALKHINSIPENCDIGITEQEAINLHRIENLKVRHALLFLLVWAKKFPHKTGWIKYEPFKLFQNLGMHYPSTEASNIIHRCYVEHMIDFKVVGSKNPIVCFKPLYQDENSPVKFTISSFDQIPIIIKTGVL